LSLGWCAVRDRWAQADRWDLILRWDPLDANAWKQWAERQSDFSLMLQGCARSVALAPEQPYYRETYALALEASRRPENYQRALEEYVTALHYAPHRAQNALAIGRILFLGKQPNQALPWFKRALQIEPHYWECDLWIARCLAQLKRPEQAGRVLSGLKTQRKNFVAWRRQVESDLPPEDPSEYQQMILAYDERVVNRELAAFGSTE
jgi:tetratricopeptide (TPR) repeat protein